jgi:hypothetical protein
VYLVAGHCLLEVVCLGFGLGQPQITHGCWRHSKQLWLLLHLRADPCEQGAADLARAEILARGLVAVSGRREERVCGKGGCEVP